MQLDFVQIYSLLEVSPLKANQFALAMLEIAETQDEIDSINWARGYALLKLKDFEGAKKVWSELYDRTKSPKALHQWGMAEMASENFQSALRCFVAEFALLEPGDKISKGANFFAMARCTFLLGQYKDAEQYIKAYEGLKLDAIEPSEKAQLLRLKSEILAVNKT